MCISFVSKTALVNLGVYFILCIELKIKNQGAAITQWIYQRLPWVWIPITPKMLFTITFTIKCYTLFVFCFEKYENKEKKSVIFKFKTKTLNTVGQGENSLYSRSQTFSKEIGRSRQNFASNLNNYILRS